MFAQGVHVTEPSDEMQAALMAAIVLVVFVVIGVLVWWGERGPRRSRYRVVTDGYRYRVQRRGSYEFWLRWSTLWDVKSREDAFEHLREVEERDQEEAAKRRHGWVPVGEEPDPPRAIRCRREDKA